MKDSVTPLVTRNKVDVRYNMNVTFNQFQQDQATQEIKSNEQSTQTQNFLCSNPTTKRAISVINQELSPDRVVAKES